MTLRTYHIETWGCQMNVLDSQRLAGLLESQGLIAVADAGHADVVLLNTCSVRDKAVQKVVSRLGALRRSRQLDGYPRLIGLCGCIAEQEGEALFARSPVVDFVLGTGRLAQLPIVMEAATRGLRTSATGFSQSRDYDADLIARGSSARQYVTAIHGCNQRCTFCVVPATRGEESSRPLAEITQEVEVLVERGAKEVTLLGQTVNAYRCPVTGLDFGDLVSRVGAIAGLWRLQFVTSHPKYFTRKMIDQLARVERLGAYLHIPFQSGSNRMLKRMNRGYTTDTYLELLGEIRRTIPGVSLSTDVMVGFPGESDQDFEETLQVMRAGAFGQLYGFVYSPRPGTPALKLEDDVPRSVAGARLDRLFAEQGTIQLRLSSGLVGREVEVLVDGPAKRGTVLWQGRGADNRVVNFQKWNSIRPGELARLRITGATAHALVGERVDITDGTPAGPA